MSWVAALRAKLHPYRYIFRVLFFVMILLASVPFVKVPGETPTPSKGTWNQYCKHKLDQLFDRYARRGPKKRLILATDVPKSLQATQFAKYFKVKEIENLSPLSKADVFWFESRRASKPTSGPCSLFFQNSVEDYEQLHLKNELYALGLKANLSDYMPNSYSLDDSSDCSALFKTISNSNASKAYMLKAEGQDVLLLSDDRIRELEASRDRGEICKGNRTLKQVQEVIHDTVLYKQHKMDFRAYVFLDSPISQRIHMMGGFARVCISPYPSLTNLPNSSEEPLDPSAFISNVRVSNAFAAQRQIENIEGEPINEFLIKNFTQVHQILQQDYSLDFKEQLESLKSILQKLLKNSRIVEHRNSQFQLFAVDFMVTQKGKLYLLEVNAFPSFVEGNPKKDRIYRRVLRSVARRIRRKVIQTRRKLTKMIHEERFNESQAVLEAARPDL